ncbi:polysaccharide deacetylase [Neobacillus bataviensis LMG 21833]|uniref:Polysaccharide deacetylase n=1 Tax=Neobacillus bataviensis LMG 21833 TaxID=1117379 RepID=K6DMH6_9BACI|nr:leucine-rich repeat domain-containing protein [Neobacillus bataviensis]EKN69383.1 polysaccharide deacetylase [Neobacillus bataviensis LMG 21833]
MIIKSISETIQTVKKSYFEYRSWRYVTKNMMAHLPKGIKKHQGSIPYINKPGIAFSFDDSFRIEHWYKYGRPIFGYYDVKATFNINGFHHYEDQRPHTQSEIDMLLDLQSNGHEIAHHGFNHKSAYKYSKEKGLKKWIEDEIISLFKWMENQSHSKTNEKFKHPVSFALPYSEYENENISEITPNYFKVVRGHLHKNNFANFNCTGFVPSICIDSVYLSNAKYMNKLMKIAKKTGRNIIFMCHSILPDDVKWDDFGWEKDDSGVEWWRTSPDTIQKVINHARKNDMEFYTTAEIAGVATFIDRNLEKSVRKQLSNPYEKWISIKELSCIKELDLSNNSISNLDGIQYFLNLEKLNLRNNQITDFRLLKKLPKLKEISIDQNPLTRSEKVAVGSVHNLLILLGININLVMLTLNNFETTLL